MSEPLDVTTWSGRHNMAFVSPTLLSVLAHRPFISGRDATVPRFATARRSCRVSMAAPAPPSPPQPPSSKTAPPATSTATSESPSPTSPPFNWMDNWYPAAWAEDVLPLTPVSFTIWQHHYVLFRDSATGEFVVMDDICPHRSAPLSEGRLYERDGADGKKETILECGYHGWRFDCSGRCVDIPVVELEKRIPAAADIGGVYATHVSIAGLIFVWLGDRAKADESKIPVPQELLGLGDRLTLFRNVRRFFPINFATVIENVADPAHVQWAHHGTGQGDRATVPRNGNLEILEKRYDEGYIKAGIRIGDAPSHRLLLWYEAPTCVGYQVVTSVLTGAFYLLTYVVPIDHDRCAIFAINAVKGLPRTARLIKRLTPRWIEHTISNHILDGDSPLLQWQETNLQSQKRDGYGGAWKNEYTLASGTWDTLVVRFRRWLDDHSDAMPYRTPIAEDAPAERLSREMINDRYEWHTKHCESCKPALRNLQRGRVAAFVGAGVGAGMALFSGIVYAALSGGSAGFSSAPLKAAAGSGLLGCVALLALGKVMTHFIGLLTYTETSYNAAHAD